MPAMVRHGDSPLIRPRPEPDPNTSVFELDEDDDAIYEELTVRHDPVQYLAPPQWEELTETPSGYLLRHDGKLFAAREIDAEGVVSAAFNRPDASAVSPPAPAPSVRSEPLKTDKVKGGS